MENLDYITTCSCDSCGRKGPVRMCHHNGTPVLAMCEGCWPSTFEAQAREDIDRWLAGGEVRGVTC